MATTTAKQKTAAAATIATLIAIPAEGLRQVAYYDPPGILTVCYGSTTSVQKGRVYSLDECKQRLNQDMLQAVEQVNKCVPNLPVETLAAFGDAVYNLGPRIACDTKNSTAARMLAMGELKLACDQLTKWDKARIAGVLVALPGLTKRRAAERELCLKGASNV